MNGDHFEHDKEITRLQLELVAMTAAVERVRTERDTVARQGERDRVASISFQNRLASMTAAKNRAVDALKCCTEQMGHTLPYTFAPNGMDALIEELK